MNIKFIRRKFSIITVVFFAVIFTSFSPLLAKKNQPPLLDVLVKISNLEQQLNTVDKLFASSSGQPSISPTLMLKGALQGTGWIDSSRLIIIGIVLKEPESDMYILIPFKEPNESFQASFNGVAGSDYYIIPRTSSEEKIVPDNIKSKLVNLCNSRAEHSMSIEMGLANLIKKNDAKIKEYINKIDDFPQKDLTNNLDFTPEETRGMLVNMLDAAAQVELLKTGFDLNETRLKYYFEAKALAGTELAGLFKKGGKTTILDAYNPEYQCSFKSRSYDGKGMLEFINNCFGKVYEKMNMDIPGLIKLCDNFTGEYAGGVSLNKDKADCEFICVLKESGAKDDFLEKVYIPWSEKYFADIVKLMGKENHSDPAGLYSRTKNSVVSGKKVVGMKFAFPLLPTGNKMPDSKTKGSLIDYEFRITTVNNLMLIAPDDRRLTDLIVIAKSLKEKLVDTPLMNFDIDMAQYIEAISKIMPDNKHIKQVDVPDMGKLSMIFDMEKGRAWSSTTINIADIKAVADYFKSIANDKKVKSEALPAQRTKAFSESREIKTQKKMAEKPAVMVKPVKDYIYWMNQGNLCSTYGNDKAAIKYFKEAIKLEPKKSEAYFFLGVSYGETGAFKESVKAINKAIDINPEKGIYYYGRGRVYLISGEQEKAVDDFKTAASKGNRDAQNYLKDH